MSTEHAVHKRWKHLFIQSFLPSINNFSPVVHEKKILEGFYLYKPMLNHWTPCPSGSIKCPTGMTCAKSVALYIFDNFCKVSAVQQKK